MPWSALLRQLGSEHQHLGIRWWEVLAHSVAAPGAHQTVEHKHMSYGKLFLERFHFQSRWWLRLGIWEAHWTLFSYEPRAEPCCNGAHGASESQRAKAARVQTGLGRTQHQRCFPGVIYPRSLGIYRNLSSPKSGRGCVCDTPVFPSFWSLLSFFSWLNAEQILSVFHQMLHFLMGPSTGWRCCS